MARRRPDLRGATGDLTLEAVTKEFGAFTAVDELDLVVPRGGVLRPARPVGLRQDDDAADGRRAWSSRPRAGCSSAAPT